MKGKTAVFFDFDGTLTRGDSLFPFLKFVTGQRYYFLLPLVVPILIALALKLMRSQSAKEAVLRIFLSGRQASDVKCLGHEFGRRLLPEMLRQEGIERLRWHLSMGHCCVLVSASLDVYLETWARDAGFEDILVSRLEVGTGGEVTGRLLGSNCQGGEKVRRIESWLFEKDVRKTIAYGNSAGDLPMICRVDEGWYWSRRQFVRRF